jgi:hypothetical protein
MKSTPACWREDHAPLFAVNNNLRRYYVHLTDRIYTPDVPWDGYAEIWWDDFASTKLRSDTRVPEPESNASESMYIFLPQPVETISKMAAALKPGGWLLLGELTTSQQSLTLPCRQPLLRSQ